MDQFPGGPEHVEHHTETVASAPRSRWRTAAAVATGSVALAGVVAVGVVATGGASGASQGAVAQESTTTTTVEDRPTADEREAKRTEKLDEVLQPLVDDGTISDAQRDAVVKRLREAAPEGGRFGRGGPGGFGHGRGFIGGGLETAAKALGVTTDELQTELRAGKSIADVAGEKNVPIDTVIDALVAEAKARIAERDLPEGRTAPTDAEIRESVTKVVNGELRFGRGHN